MLTVLTGESALIGDLGAAIDHDPEVRQARRIADAARTRLVACMTGSSDGIDPAEAQRMLDAFRNALAHAEEAEDQVLVHRGLLTSVEAARRAARRRPVISRVGRVESAGRARNVQRGIVAHAIAGAFALATAGVVGVAVARRAGLRPPLTRW